ncbi:family 78 glycoside hydrolase catalytic domain [Cohnella sp. GCM10020058]|uniref:family 78 glycoside hydrolase catalytic domain n=1 Tax=Cohnella sp. GCM10020058 TaxID=3317330 RepID=UPI00363523CA
MEENRTWNARWIWHQGYPWTSDPGAHEMVWFRREFEVADPQLAQLVVDVSADSRYRLYLNGESVSVGPCKGDRSTHYYETVDLSERLMAGTNVLAVQVLHFAPSGPHLLGVSGPLSIHRAVTGAMILEGILIEGNGRTQALHSDEKWLCKKMPGFKVVPSPIVFFLGGFEDTDGSGLDHGWELPGYVGQGWANAVIVCETGDRFGQLTPWQLTPRPIPPMRETPASFRSITKADDRSAIPRYEEMLEGEGARNVSVEAGQSIWLELDAGELVTGYVTLKLRGGRGSRIKLLYAECYEEPTSNLHHRVKGMRDDAENGILIGEADCYTVAGVGTGEKVERYEPFDFRTFRYIRLEVEVKDEPLEIAQLSYRDAGYPLDVQAAFSCSDPDYVALWQLSLNTLRRCMHETYEDCPYYEQLQYTMDTRLQMMFTYAVSTDDRLARRALFDYHSSALPSGMLQSRYPSEYRQVIPSFSLYWIHMLDEHFLHFGDQTLIRRYVPTMTGVLDWFRRMLTPDGLVGPTPQAYWPYFDWSKDWEIGTPPAHEKGPLTLLNQMYAAALHAASRIYGAVGWQDAAREAKADANAINEALIQLCWRPEIGLFADGPEAGDFSQHAQVWGVVCGAVQGEDAVRLLERTIDPQADRMTQLSVPASYELFRMLSRHGLYDKASRVIDRWKAFLHSHLTTLPEVTDDNHPRSDCHAWSALPLSEFTGEILGVRPGRPGYAEIIVAPKPLQLTWAQGSVATHRGAVEVEWTLDEETVFRMTGHGPEGIPLTVVLPNGERIEFKDGGRFEASANLRA